MDESIYLIGHWSDSKLQEKIKKKKGEKS